MTQPVITIYNKPETENSVAIEDKNIQSEGRADILGKRFSFVASDFQSVTIEQKKSVFSVQTMADSQMNRKFSNQLEYESSNRVETPKNVDPSPAANKNRLFAKKPAAVIISVRNEEQDAKLLGARGLESLKVTVNDP